MPCHLRNGRADSDSKHLGSGRRERRSTYAPETVPRESRPRTTFAPSPVFRSPVADSMIGFSTDAEGCETGYWLAGQNATFFAPRSENCGTHIAIPSSATHTSIIGAISEGLGNFRDDRSTSTY